MNVLRSQKGTPLPFLTSSYSTPFTKAYQLPFQTDMILNLLIRIDRKLTNLVDKIVKIEEKLQQLEAIINLAKETKVPKALVSIASQSSERVATNQFESATFSHGRETEKEIPKYPNVTQAGIDESRKKSAEQEEQEKEKQPSTKKHKEKKKKRKNPKLKKNIQRLKKVL